MKDDASISARFASLLESADEKLHGYKRICAFLGAAISAEDGEKSQYYADCGSKILEEFFAIEKVLQAMENDFCAIVPHGEVEKLKKTALELTKTTLALQAKLTALLRKINGDLLQAQSKDSYESIFRQLNKQNSLARFCDITV